MGNRLIRTALALLPGLAVVSVLASAVGRSLIDPAQAAPAAEKPAPANAESTKDEDADGPMIDPMGPNSACYVCHMTFVAEELSRTHLAEEITCIECHGLSAAHANDENIGATPPDVTYERNQVDASCEKCHKEHDVPANLVVARFLERKLKVPNPICTDCHGTHRIEHAEEDPEAEDVSAGK